MSRNDEQDNSIYIVLINAEEQYSLWLKHTAVPAGWRAVGKEGTKAECSKYVEEVWTDMRGLSLRRRMHLATDA
jgi:MbtH protein